jgi:hypothetical protein
VKQRGSGLAEALCALLYRKRQPLLHLRTTTRQPLTGPVAGRAGAAVGMGWRRLREAAIAWELEGVEACVGDGEVRRRRVRQLYVQLGL